MFMFLVVKNDNDRNIEGSWGINESERVSVNLRKK